MTALKILRQICLREGKLVRSLVLVLVFSAMALGKNSDKNENETSSPNGAAQIAVISQKVEGLSASSYETGRAAWYDVVKLYNRGKLSGSLKDRIKKYGTMVAAHKTLPLGTKVLVKCLDTQKSVLVTIVDRGPFSKGFVIDLSKEAGDKLGLRTKGTTRVRLSILK